MGETILGRNNKKKKEEKVIKRNKRISIITDSTEDSTTVATRSADKERQGWVNLDVTIFLRLLLDDPLASPPEIAEILVWAGP